MFDDLAGVDGVALAVSGGADSAALMLLAAEWAGQASARHPRPPLTVLTVDHGLRPAAAGEAAKVAAWCANLGLPHRTLALRLAPSSDQSTLRQARYAALTEAAEASSASHLLTAHHLDDQAETLLLRLGRGSGLRGLTGMQRTRPLGPVTLVRPLLGLPGARLRATCAARGLAWIEDASNADPRYARARLRAMAPELAGVGLTSQRLADTACRLARAQAAIDGMVAERLRVAVVHPIGAVVVPLEAFEAADEVALRMLEAVLRTVGGRYYPPRMERLEAALEWTRGAASPAASSKTRRTLHGCLLAVRGTALAAVREAGRFLPVDLELGANATGVWDGRFAVEADAPVTVGLGSRDTPWRALLESSGLEPELRRRAGRMAPSVLKGDARGITVRLRCDAALPRPSPLVRQARRGKRSRNS